MTPRFSFVLVLGALALAAGTGASAQSARPRELSHVKQLGAALAEYNNGSMHAVAAYYYSQRNHDSRWLLIEIGIMQERAAVDEIAAQVADRALDFALGLRAIRTTGAWREVPVAREAEKLHIADEGAAFESQIARADSAHLIKQQLLRHPLLLDHPLLNRDSDRVRH